MTKKEIIDDVILRITIWKRSNDLELERSQVEHWVGIVGDEIVSDAIKANLMYSSSVPSNYITIERALPFQKDNTLSSSDEGDRNFVEISKTPMGLPYDSGVTHVTTDSGKEILNITYTYLHAARELEMSKPNISNPLYYREQKKIYIEGFSNTMMYGVSRFRNLTIDVYYVPSFTSFNSLEELPIDNDLGMELTDRVEDIARRQHKEINDLINDGVE